MRVEDVPQDKGMIGDFGREVCYAVDKDGRYTLSPSLGWEAKNVVNDQAWGLIVAEAEKMHQLVQCGKLSPIAYYQARHQMDISLLASYVRMAKWRVKRHRRPEVFQRLSAKILQKYAAVFEISVDELQNIPLTFSPTEIRRR